MMQDVNIKKAGDHLRNNLLQEFSLVAEAYFVSAFFAAFFTTAVLAGRLLPNEPLKRFPFAVFLSPLPIVIYLNCKSNDDGAIVAL